MIMNSDNNNTNNKNNSKSKLRSTIETHSTKILSWNIQSSNTISGYKFDDQNFCKIIEQFKLVCLQETRKTIKIAGFRSFNNVRRGEKHGGVCILVNNDISDGVSKINTSINDVIVCKLKKSFFNLASDIILVNAYVKPANTSSKTNNTDGYDTLRELDILINDLRSKGDIILCGDFNSRISTELDFIENDSDNVNSFIPLPDDYEVDNLTRRNSQDSKTNNYKRLFLELLINNSIHIANGRTLGDFRGGYTCIQPNGSSVVDYFIISSGIRKLVNYMTIMEFTAYSDHKPISLCLKLSDRNHIRHDKLHNAYDKAPLRYKFSDDDKENYTNTQQNIDMVTLAQNIIDRTYDNSTDGTIILNNDITNYLQTVANNSLKKTKHMNNNRTNKNPWFNSECRAGKRSLNKAARIVSKFPDSDYLRKNFYKTKKLYKKVTKRNKTNFYDKLNEDIKQGKIINWKQFNRLKKLKTTEPQFDSYDMKNFENFFEDLYSNKHSSINLQQKEEFLEKADDHNQHFTSESDLNKPISSEEISSSIKNLNNGKSSSSDMVCNEMLKYLNSNGTSLLLKLFNNCLDTGCYPWNHSIISPIHKKGDREDPDNYRAIAVSSTIGKLFSTILLDRFIEFRKQNCPDPPNQLGFTKGAQTYDHILTLNTITSKYKKLGKSVFAVFVDFKKAFDSVCREALFYKLSQSGIAGKFYNVLRHMYANSSAQIKLSGYVSKSISIRKGTEQGHPLSPDLFKAYLSDLSPLLDNENCPKLIDKLVSHLLWADDLIILALDEKTIQNQLNELNRFCLEWGVEININKTKLMIFNDSLRHPPMSHSFHIGNKLITEVDSYCYLGITIHKSGSFSLARHELKNKASRALYSLMRTVNKTKLSYTSLCNLFDTLIKPIALYGAPLWCPSISIVKHLSKIATHPDNNNLTGANYNQNTLRKISLINCEKIHLRFLKWALGINRRASNVGTWGESGRYPLIYECLNITMKYITRLKSTNTNSLVSLAFREQQRLQLDWFRHMEPILKLDPAYTSNHVSAYNIMHNSSHSPNPTNKKPSDFLIHNGFVKKIPNQTLSPEISQHFTAHIVMKNLKLHFRKTWSYTKEHSPRLEFYNQVKSKFMLEEYLSQVNNYYDRANLTKLRTSAHELQIELGRRKGIARQERHCKWCKLSMNIEIVEDEDHLLHKCDLYSSIRQNALNKLSDITQSNISYTSNFMELLNHVNHNSSLNSSQPQSITQHNNAIQTHHMTQHHSDKSTNTRSNLHFGINVPSPSTFLSRTIAKFTTLCFDQRKKLSSPEVVPIPFDSTCPKYP